VREALAEVGRTRQLPAGALKAAGAAAYLGLSRSRFYELLREDPALKELSFTVGRCRLWKISALDSWIHARQSEKSSERCS
jgi:hypothetical protein